jgi:curved DNA-binding protein
MIMAKDFYKILGVERKADEKEIKKAYRKLARRHHPDVNPNDKGAETKFKAINEAFQVLSDTEKRAAYDQFGDDYDKYGPVPNGAAAGAAYGNAGRGGYASGVNIEDLFNQASRQRAGVASGAARGEADHGDVFGGIFGRRARGPQKGEDVEQTLEISLPESVKGTQRALKLTISDPHSGKSETRNVTVKIPAGVREGARVRVAGQGASSDNGGPNGDLFLAIKIAPHPVWKRDGDNLSIEVPVSLSEAALGATIEVPTQSGSVQLKIPAATQSGQKFRLSGRGVATKSGTSGDQYVVIKIAVPKELSARERELMEELASLRPDEARRDFQKNATF